MPIRRGGGQSYSDQPHTHGNFLWAQIFANLLGNIGTIPKIAICAGVRALGVMTTLPDEVQDWCDI